MAQDKKKHIVLPPGASGKPSQRIAQAEEIMQQLIAEGTFAENEAAEIVFSDMTVVRVPDKDEPVN